MSRRRKLSEAEQRHADWIGMLQPEGLVVSVPVLVDHDAYVKQPPETQGSLRVLCPDEVFPDRAAFDRFLSDMLGWPASRLAAGEAAEPFAVPLPELGVVLRPDAALVDRNGAPILYVTWSDQDLDASAGDPRWPVSRQGRFERLLLESQRPNAPGTPIGVHACPTAIRLTYAPRGEAPGSLTFPIDALYAFDGRLLVDALWMLLGADRLFTVPEAQRLPAILRDSRQRQEKVTEELAGQVEEALEILVAGFDVANQRRNGALLRALDGDDGVEQFRAGLVTVLLRLVFLLYCEDQGVLPTDNPFYLDNYSLAGLADKLQEDRVLYPEAMRHRYGAWARLCALFRLVWSGARHKDLTLPARQGDLFNPHDERFLFLEGRFSVGAEDGELPPVDDGVVDDVLERLVYLEGQRISYRNLDVEQIGSVYEALMALGFRRAESLAIPLRGGAWVEVNDVLGADRPSARIGEAMGLKPAELLKRAPALAALDRGEVDGEPIDAVRAALAPVTRTGVEPRPAGTHYVGAGSERRRTGSHYTPSTLTRPIVERTLSPVLDQNGAPSSATILGLKVCDPAMGSGAFLAEACRYLSRRLLDAWTREGKVPPEARDGDPLLYARRLIAERCLYGVDKNPFAVQLARLSLWLVTLSKDLPFTFVDHALREGDAVIGLTSQQIAAFSFEGKGAAQMFGYGIRRSIDDAVRARALIHQPDLFSWNQKTAVLNDAQEDVYTARTRGDLLLAHAWAGGTAKEQKARAARIHPAIDAWYLGNARERLNDECMALVRSLEEIPLNPFHWELEFPEVFARENPGFDAVVGNPPFVAGKAIRTDLGEAYARLLALLRPDSNGNADLSAHFFLRAKESVRKGACFGLVATNTIKQGETRAGGLQLLAAQGVTFYAATTDTPWPVLGGAAVVVDVVHGKLGQWDRGATLNGVDVAEINSALEAGGEQDDPVALRANEGLSFIGSFACGIGFVLDPEEGARLCAQDPHNAEVVRPYMGGEELNTEPALVPIRCIVDFFDRPLEVAQMWPEVLALVETRVKPERTRLRDDGTYQLRSPLPQRWWQFADKRPALYAALPRLSQGRCLVCSRVSKHHLIAFQPTSQVFGDSLVVFALDDWLSFAVLQSRVHEWWARKAGLTSTMKTDTRYTPSTCFETFPFPRGTQEQRNAAAEAGRALYEHRSVQMLRFNEGMTKIWNRLLSPDEHDPEVAKLRALREAMDSAVLACYGWADLAPDDIPAIVKRLRALNAERAAEETARVRGKR